MDTEGGSEVSQAEHHLSVPFCSMSRVSSVPLPNSS